MLISEKTLALGSSVRRGTVLVDLFKHTDET